MRKYREKLEILVRERTSELQETNTRLETEIEVRKQVSERLRESEEKYHSIFWEAPDIFFVLDLETMIITDANKCALEKLEYDADIIGKIDISKIVHPDDFARSSQRLTDMVINKDRMPNFPLRVVTSTGKIRHIEQNGVVFWDEDGNAKSFLGLAHDLTERKEAEEEKRLSEERYQRILDSSHDIILVANENGQILYANDAHKEQTGYTVEEANEMGNFAIIHPDDQEKAAHGFVWALQGESIRNVEYRRVRKVGEIRWVLSNADPISWPGAEKAVVITARDITERKQAEEELRQSHERYHKILDACHDMITVIDEDTNVLFANRAVHENTGYSMEDIRSIDGFDTIHPDDREEIGRWFLRILNGEPARGVEYRGLHKSGETRWVESNANKIRWDNGRRSVVNVLRDITDLKKSEEEVRLSEERYRKILEASLNNVAVMDKDGTPLFVNRSWQEDTGYSLDDFAEKPFSTVTHPDDLEKVTKWFLRVLKGESLRSVEYQRINKSGEIRWVVGSASPISWPGVDEAVVNVSLDITDHKRAEEETRLLKERYERILDSSHDNIFVFDNYGRIVYANKAWEKETGYTLDEVRDRNDFNIIHPDDIARVGESIQRMMAEEEARNLQYRRINKGGEVRWVESNASLTTWPGAEMAIVSITRDITERRRQEEALRESEERYRNLFENSIEGIFVMDLEGNFASCNPAMEKVLGCASDELIGKSYRETVAPEAHEMLYNEYNNLFRNGEPIRNLRYENLRKDGERRTVESNISLMSEGGQITGFQGTARDITDQVLAEDALMESEERYRSLVDSSLTAIYVVQDGKLRFANERAEEMLGYSRKELIETPFIEFVHPEDREYAAAMTKDRISGKSPRGSSQIRVIHKSGDIRWIDAHGAMIDYQGKPAMLSNAADITEHKKNEEALRESEERLRALLNACADTALFLIDTEGNFLTLNETLAQRFGMSVDEAIGQNVYAFLEPEVGANRKKRIDDVINTGKPVRFEDERAGIVFDNNLYPLIDQSGKVSNVAIYAKDITERKKNEEALRKSEKRLRALLNACTDAAFLADVQGHFLSVNEALAGRHNKTIEEMSGLKFHDVLPPELAESRMTQFEQVVRTGKAVRFEDERAGKLHDINLYPISDSDEKISQVAVYARDITEQRQAERELNKTLEELEQRVKQRTAELSKTNEILEDEVEERKRAYSELRDKNKKLVELEQIKEDLINMVVHDMKNPVTNTLLALDMIEADPGNKLTERQNEYFGLLRRTQFGLSEMIGNLLEISKLESGAMTVRKSSLNLLDLVNKVVKGFTAEAEVEGKTVEVTVDGDARTVLADRRLLERVLSNILSNAIKHSYPNGEVHVRVLRAKDENTILMRVQDFGEGIPEEDQEKIFEKFVQVNMRKLGRRSDTGLGLTFCKMAIEALGGRIWVDSEPGMGSCFTVSLPGALGPR